MNTNQPRPRRVGPVEQDPKALVWARKRSGWHQAEFARQLGISRAFLCELEKGTRSARPALLNKMAEVLNCPVTVLERKREQVA